MQNFNYQKRLQNLFNFLQKKNISAFLTFSPANFFYFTGFTGDAGNLLFLNLIKPKTILSTNSLYFQQAKKECLKKILVLKETKSLEKIFKELKKNKIKKLIVDETNFSASAYVYLKKNLKKTKIIFYRDILPSRKIKEEIEINLIKNASKQASAIYEKVMQFAAINKTELEVAKYASSLLLKTNAEKISFLIIASGENSAYPHWQPSNKKINKGDLVIFDWGASYKKYCCDITRTFVIGKANKIQKEIYQAVLNCQQQTIAQVKAGVKAKSLMQFAKKSLGKFKKYFTHGLGHSLGLEIHEPPYLNLKSKEVLKENMLLTIEPGVYIAGVGGVRIEDTILVKKNGAEVLSNLKKELIEI